MQLCHSLSSLACAHAFVVGDMNLVATGKGRLDASIGAMRQERQEGAEFLEENVCVFPEFPEVVVDGNSMRQFSDREVDVSSRKDRVMMHSCIADMGSVRASARVISWVVGAELPSDHVAMEFALSLSACARQDGTSVAVGRLGSLETSFVVVELGVALCIHIAVALGEVRSRACARLGGSRMRTPLEHVRASKAAMRRRQP